MIQFLFKSEENLIFEGKDYIHLHAESVINTVFKFLFFLYIYIYRKKRAHKGKDAPGPWRPLRNQGLRPEPHLEDRGLLNLFRQMEPEKENQPKSMEG